jgi:hypothetical protein
MKARVFQGALPLSIIQKRRAPLCGKQTRTHRRDIDLAAQKYWQKLIKRRGMRNSACGGGPYGVWAPRLTPARPTPAQKAAAHQHISHGRIITYSLISPFHKSHDYSSRRPIRTFNF